MGKARDYEIFRFWANPQKHPVKHYSTRKKWSP